MTCLDVLSFLTSAFHPFLFAHLCIPFFLSSFSMLTSLFSMVSFLPSSLLPPYHPSFLPSLPFRPFMHLLSMLSFFFFFLSFSSLTSFLSRLSFLSFLLSSFLLPLLSRPFLAILHPSSLLLSFPPPMRLRSPH